MANKLTSKKLEELIEQVLNENISIDLKDKLGDIEQLRKDLGFVKNPPSLGGNVRDIKKNIKNLTKLENPPNTLDKEDFEDAFANPNSDEYQTAKALKGSTNKALADMARDLDPGYQPKSITAPRSYDAGAASGNFIKGIESIFKSVLSSAGDIKGKIEAINKVSEELFDMSKIGQIGENSQAELMRKLLAMDYLQMLTFDIDSKREGGYDFEAFLAMIASGGVSGGENKAGDFVTPDGTPGSAKYVEKFEIKQSLSGFEKGQEMVYVVARKRGDEKTPNAFAFTKKGNPSRKTKYQYTRGQDAAPTTGGAADPDKIIYVNMHVFKVKVTNTTGSTATFDIIDYTTGNVIEKNKTGSLTGETLLTNSQDAQAASFVGQLKLRHSVGTKKTLTQYLDSELANSADTNKEKAKEAYNLLKNYFSGLFKLDNEARDYIATDDRTDQVEKGNKLLQGYDDLDNQLVGIINVLRGDETKATVKTGDRTKLSEKNQTKSLKDLDKLIERVILDKMNKL